MTSSADPQKPSLREAIIDDNSPPDLDERILCEDGNCVGVIGDDGRCKECGKPMSIETVKKKAAPPAGSEKSQPPADVNSSTGNNLFAADDDEAPDLDNRQLCSDGNCVGIIGPDGRCKECGKPFAD